MKKYLLFLLAIWMPVMAWAVVSTHTLTIKSGAKFYITVVNQTNGRSVNETVVKDDSEYIVTYLLTEGDTYTITIDPLKYENDYIYSQFTAWMRDEAFYSKSTELNLTMGKSDIDLTAVSTRVAEPPYSPGANYYDASTGTLTLDEIRNANTNGINGAYRAAKAMYKFEDSDVQTVVVAGDLTGAYISIVDAFGKCPNLLSIDLSQTSGITALRSSEYSGTNYKLQKLEHIALGASIEEIAPNAFFELQQLKTIDCYATTPPSCDPKAFDVIDVSTISLMVPAESIELYRKANGWKDFSSIQSLNEIGNISVKLPTDVPDGYYEDMIVELTNLRSYMVYNRKVLNKRLILFGGQIRGAEYQVTVKNAYGQVTAQTEAVELGANDLTFTIDKLLRTKDVTVKVTTPEGTDVTDRVSLRWKDEADKVIGYVSRLKAVAEGYQLTCQVSISNELARRYVVPPHTQITVDGEGDNLLTIVLQPVQPMALYGYVKDAETGNSIEGATIALTQQQGGYYDQSVTATTDKNGRYDLQGTNKPGNLTVSAPGHQTETAYFEFPDAGGALPTIELEPKYDIIVNAWLTYTENVPEGEESTESNVIDGYKGYSDVVYQVYNQTKKLEVKNFVVHENTLSFPNRVDIGNELTITATSRSNDFLPASASCEIGKHGVGSVTLDLQQTPRGHMVAKVTGVPDSVSVMGVLYHSNGRFARSKIYKSDSLVFADLPNNDYNLITMTSNTLLRRVLLQSTLDDMGLVEGTDYVKTPVHIQSGVTTKINVGKVPAMDMEKLHFTDKNTYFIIYRNTLEVDQSTYITSQLSFAEKYAERISNVEVMVDMPDEIELVENSAYEGFNKPCKYRIEDGRYIFPITDLAKHKLTFNLKATKEGEYRVSGSVRFNLDGSRIIQPIGTAWLQVLNPFIMNPPEVLDDAYDTHIYITGIAPRKYVGREVEIYDYDQLVGKAKVYSWGQSWSIDLTFPKTGSTHVHAFKGRVAKSETDVMETEVQYVSHSDHIRNAERVVMMTQKNSPVTFDFVNNTITPDHYVYVLKQYWSLPTPYNTTFTFLAYFDNLEEPESKKVKIIVLASDGTTRTFDAKYDEANQCFHASSKYSSSTKIPVSVCAYYEDFSFKPIKDEEKEAMKEEMLRNMDVFTRNVMSLGTKGEIELLPSDDSTLIFNYSVNGSDPFAFVTKEIDYDQAVNYALENGPFTYSNEEDSILYTFVSGKDEAEMILINVNERAALRTAISEAEITDLPGATGREKAGPHKVRLSGLDRLKMWGNMAYAASAISTAEGLMDYARVPERLTDMEVRFEQYERDTKTIRDKIWNYIMEPCSDGKLKWGHEQWVYICNRDNALLDQGTYSWGKLQEFQYEYKHDLRRKAVWDVGTTVLSTAFGEAAMTGAAKKIGPRAVEMLKDVREFAETDAGHAVGNILGAATDFITDATLPDLDELFGLDFTRHYNAYDDFFNKEYQYVMSAWESFYQEVLSMHPEECQDEECEGENCEPGSENPDDPDDPGNDDDDREKDDDDDDVKRIIVPRNDPKDGSSYDIPYYSNDDYYKRYLKRNKKTQAGALVDPSGYVYEAVPSNRVEGATATIYYKDYMLNSSGNSTGEQDVMWDAENYSQINPQITDSTGMYQWDVPQGLWQVRVQKEGYESNQTDWLPVPPPQLDVNIPVIRNRLPKVEKAHAYEHAVTAKFDSYMLPDLLNAEQITVTENGTVVPGTIEMSDEETAPSGCSYASQFRFIPSTPFTANEVTLYISGAVQNYSGIEMDEPFEAVLPIEQEVKTLVADRSVKVLYQHAKVVHVKGEPAAAAAGKTVTLSCASGIIASTTENSVVLNRNGEAEIIVQGNIPGTEFITFTMSDPGLTTSTMVNVMAASADWVDAPEASVPSETEVEIGTTVTLNCRTEGATVYYTLDGSNPSESDTRILYDGTPVIINKETTLKTIAVLDNKGMSDVRTYHYTVKQETSIMNPAATDIRIIPVRVHDAFEVVGVDGTFSLSVYSMAGVLQIQLEQMTANQMVNATALQTGVYIVVVNGDNTHFTLRIIKE